MCQSKLKNIYINGVEIVNTSRLVNTSLIIF